MDRDVNQFIPRNGMEVIGADGEKVGEIDGIEQDYFVVRKGFFFPQDHYIPLTAISSFDDEQVFLNVTKDEALEQEWGNPPTSDYAETTTSGDQTTLVSDHGGAYGDADLESGAGGVVPDSGYVGQAREPEVATYNPESDTLAGIETRVDRGTNLDQDNTTVDVHEEELVANEPDADRGGRRIDKNGVE